MPFTTTEPLSPRARQIVAAARELLEERGVDGWSMRILAERVGIRAPSLYKHFASKEALEATLISLAYEEQTEVFRAALERSAEPMVAMSEAYRAYAHENPQLYRLMYDRPINRSLIVPGVEDAAAEPAEQAAGGDVALARAAWAFSHGMTILELNERYRPGADLEAAWRRGISALQAAAEPDEPSSDA